MQTAAEKDIYIALRIEDASTLSKLTKSDSTMPSWVLGEAIAKKLKKGHSRHIEINLADLFMAHRV